MPATLSKSYTTPEYIPTEPQLTEDELSLQSIEEWQASQKLEALAIRVCTHFDWAKNCTDRKNFEERSEDAQKFWLSKQWDGIKSFSVPGRSSDRKKLKPCPVDNYYKSQVEGLVGDICDSPADIQLQPREPGDDEICEAMLSAVEHVLYVNKFQRKLEYVVRRGILYGPMMFKVRWNPTWQGGRKLPFSGEVEIIGISPDNFFIDPRIKGVEPEAIQRAGFLIYSVPRSLAHVYRAYPWVKESIVADQYASYTSTLSGPLEELVTYDEDTSVAVIEYWYYGLPLAPDYPSDSTHIKWGQEGTPGYHLCTIASGVVLQHATYCAPRYPFAVDYMYPSDESAYGYGDGYDMLMPQLVINKLNEMAIEGHSVSTVGNWLVKEGALRNPSQFQKYANTGGTMLPVSDLNDIRRELGGGVPSSLFAHYGQEQRAMETVSGRVDISQGRSPRGIRAASAISLLLQQAAGRVRQRSRAVSSVVEQVVLLILDYIDQYYMDERLIRLMGPDGKVTWKTYKRDEVVREITRNPADGESYVERYIPDMDVLVTVGAETPTSKAYFSELAFELFQAEAIDVYALLDILDFPRWRSIRRRMEAAANPAEAAPTQGKGGEEMAVTPQQLQDYLEGLVKRRYTLQDLPPEVVQGLIQAIASGAVPLDIFPPEVQQQLQQLMGQAGGGQMGGAPRQAPPGANPMQQQQIAANGGAPGMQGLRQSVNRQAGY